MQRRLNSIELRKCSEVSVQEARAAACIARSTLALDRFCAVVSSSRLSRDMNVRGRQAAAAINTLHPVHSAFAASSNCEGWAGRLMTTTAAPCTAHHAAFTRPARRISSSSSAHFQAPSTYQRLTTAAAVSENLRSRVDCSALALPRTFHCCG